MKRKDMTREFRACGLPVAKVFCDFKFEDGPDRVVGYYPKGLPFARVIRCEIDAPSFEWELNNGERFAMKSRPYVNREGPDGPDLDFTRCFQDAVAAIQKTAAPHKGGEG